MSYREDYPHLYDAYLATYRHTFADENDFENNQNFDAILEVLETHYSDMFDLEVLNRLAGEGNHGSYMQLYEECLGTLGLQALDKPRPGRPVIKRRPRLAEEIIPLLHAFFDKKENQDEWLLRLTMIPPEVEGARQRQIGFLEKLATDNADPRGIADPLTFIDMMRLVRGMTSLKGSPANIAVVHAKHLPHLSDETRASLKQRHAVFVNLSTDLKAKPKWAVIDFSRGPDKARVFCEMALSDSELVTLEHAFHFHIGEDEDRGDVLCFGKTATSVQTTGYTASTWLNAVWGDEDATRINQYAALAANKNGDFPSLAYDVIAGFMVGLDNVMVPYTCLSEEEALCTDSFRSFKQLQNLGNTDKGFSRDFGRSMIALVRASVPGLYDKGRGGLPRFMPGDLASTLKAIYANRDGYAKLQSVRDESARYLIPGFMLTLAKTKIAQQASPDAPMQLQIPKALLNNGKVNLSQLYSEHFSAVSGQFGSAWLKNAVNRFYGEKEQQVEAITLILFAFIRAYSRNLKLDINLGNLQGLGPIKDADIEVIEHLLQANAFITEFEVHENVSLGAMKERLAPIFARNKWLHEDGYKPALSDD
ncbi:MAG: hypothetical protein P1U32_06425, partial [Legionellaceae bacterium]|nr:hypothetical protein [Legionellaceae bacterium]